MKQCPTESDRSRVRRRIYKLLGLAFILLGLALALPAAAFAASSAGWSPQTSGTFEDLTAVACVNASDAWAVGGDGTILATTNGGASWSAQTSGEPATVTLTAVTFVNTNDGWAVGAYVGGAASVILATTNGGATWNLQYTDWTVNGPSVLYGVAFANANDGWAVGFNGDGGVILATTNGGATWSVQQYVGTGRDLTAVACVNASDAWAVGYDETTGDGVILATTNGGVPWSVQSSDMYESFAGVAFANASDGWAVGNGLTPGSTGPTGASTILATTNGGATWSVQSSDMYEGFTGVAFANANDGWVVGCNDSPGTSGAGVILATTDGGIAWSAQGLPAGAAGVVTAVAFANVSDGWAVGSGILATTDGGVPAAPTITGFTPVSGLVRSSVTLTGSSFTNATALSFNGVATSFTVNSDTQITATVPIGATSGPITVTTPAGTATSTIAFTVGPPSSVDTLSALMVNGTPLTGFTAATTTYNVVLPYGTIFVPTVSATTTDPNATAVITQALSVTGTATVKVAAQDGVSNETYTINFSVAPSSVDTLSNLAVSPGTLSPAFTSNTLIYSDSVANSVANITVTPTTNGGEATALEVGGATVSNPIALSVGATVIDVVVTAQNGASETYIVTVTRAAALIPTPTLTAFTPTSGLVGSSVTLTGTNFTGATAVKFNGHVAAFTVRSATQIIARVPNGATSGTIAVTTPGGKATSTARFTVLIKPTLTIKLSGLASGVLRLGKSLTVTGKVTPTSLAGSKVTLTVQYKRGNTWVKVTSWLRGLTTSGTYSATYKPSKRASYRIEATIAATTSHTAATTAWLAFTVK